MNNTMYRIISGLLALLTLLTVMSNVKAETVTYYFNDLSGSPVAAMDSSGNRIWRESYQPFGEKRVKPSASNNDIGYTGHQNDDFIGLTYMQARYYDSTLGRFYGVDPIDFRDVHSFNKYTYANNNPYLYRDPDGKQNEATFDMHVMYNNFGQSGVDRYKNNRVGVDQYLILVIPGSGVGDIFTDFKQGNYFWGVIGVLLELPGAKFLRGLGPIKDFMESNAKRFNQKLGDKIGQGRLNFEKSKAGVEKAKKAVEDTLNQPTHVSEKFTNSNGDKVVDIYSEKTGYTVRVREDGSFDTLIEGSTGR